eukprot:12035207-Ditylum_brightwellii.AAC.1
MPDRCQMDQWKHPKKHPYVEHMSQKWYRQIKSVLHLNNDENKSKSNDYLYKVRPLLNVLKKMLGLFFTPGNDMALDKSSVA